MPEKITHLIIRKFMLHQKKKIVFYFKEDTIDSEKLQSEVPSLTSRERTVQAGPSKREERKKISRKGKGKRRRESANKKEKEKEKKKEKKKKKEK